MHHLAPFPIIIGVIGVILGLLWLVSVGPEKDGGPNTGLFFVFGSWYLALRVFKALIDDPMSVLPAFGILIGSGVLIWIGVIMI